MLMHLHDTLHTLLHLTVCLFVKSMSRSLGKVGRFCVPNWGQLQRRRQVYTAGASTNSVISPLLPSLLIPSSPLLSCFPSFRFHSVFLLPCLMGVMGYDSKENFLERD
jgi:hypothetical protein